MVNESSSDIDTAKKETRLKGLFTTLFTLVLLGSTARADDPLEFWSELNGFFSISPGTRIFLDAAYANGKESESAALDLAAYLDISLKPIRSAYLEREDWQRSRYFWARIGYDHVFRSTNGVHSPEERGIISFWEKFGLPEAIWLEARERADLRWMGGEYSTRYRFRLEATHEFVLFERTVVPYLNAEFFYDTRYDGLARILYQAGAEATITDHFRFELNVSRQMDYLPDNSGLYAVGYLAKFYF